MQWSAYIRIALDGVSSTKNFARVLSLRLPFPESFLMSKIIWITGQNFAPFCVRTANFRSIAFYIWTFWNNQCWRVFKCSNWRWISEKTWQHFVSISSIPPNFCKALLLQIKFWQSCIELVGTLQFYQKHKTTLNSLNSCERVASCYMKVVVYPTEERFSTRAATFFQAFRAVVLNRGYTYHLGVRGAKTGGTKHQSLQGYTLWKFKPDFIEHSSWFSVVWRTIIHSLELVRYTLWILYLACLHSKSAVA